eukprot:2366753-Rhodomonas_salina.1
MVLKKFQCCALPKIPRYRIFFTQQRNCCHARQSSWNTFVELRASRTPPSTHIHGTEAGFTSPWSPKVRVFVRNSETALKVQGLQCRWTRLASFPGRELFAQFKSAASFREARNSGSEGNQMLHQTAW